MQFMTPIANAALTKSSAPTWKRWTLAAIPTGKSGLRRHPDLAPDLRGVFTDQDKADRWAGPLRPVGEAALTEALSAGTTPHDPQREGKQGVAGERGDLGDCELLAILGQGGMGVVYRARQKGLNRVVAVKVPRSGQLTTPAEVRRFHHEAEAAARLDHPNIVPIYEVSDHNGQPFFSMKLVEGGSLAARRDSFAGDARAAARLLETVAGPSSTLTSAASCTAT